MKDIAGMNDRVSAGASVCPGLAQTVRAPRARFDLTARDKDGNILWSETAHNIVTNGGLNDILDKYLKGSTYSASWFVGLKGTGSVAAGDTLASHDNWSEITAYADNRKTATFGTVASQSVDNTASPAVFAINDTATIAGAFLCTASTGTSGVLYNVADFTAPRSLGDGDTLTVNVTLTAADA